LRIECEPLFRDKFSRDLVLALFSSALARPQPDWPVNTTQPGFVFYDRDGDPAGGDERLEAFLRAGTPPIVFTLGSSAVHNPKDFFAVSAEAAKLVGRRAVLIGADRGESRLPDAIAVPYAPYSEVFPRAAAIVHQGGSGTTGQAMRAGRPMLVVPYGWDQPDNGARIERMGIGLMLSKRRYAPEKAAMALQRLLEEEAFAARAVAVQGQVLAENAIVKACDAIDSLPSRLH
jgi:UDP:flavonoid glycosyltransferase YjiC (YdhE family)